MKVSNVQSNYYTGGSQNYQTGYQTSSTYVSPVYQGVGQSSQPKYQKSKNECIEELTMVLAEIDRKD